MFNWLVVAALLLLQKSETVLAGIRYAGYPMVTMLFWGQEIKQFISSDTEYTIIQEYITRTIYSLHT